MAQISAAQVKALRDRTDAGMMDCKKALVEADGDAAKALDLLRERGMARARGRAGRATSEGCIVTRVSEDGTRAALLEINCETDFVARTDEFETLCTEVAERALQEHPADIDALLALPSGDSTLNDVVLAAMSTLGENIHVRRFDRLEASPGSRIASYVHAGGKLGALVQIESSDPTQTEVQELAHNLCLQVVATSPLGVAREDIAADQVERERSVLVKQLDGEGKPPEIVEKIVNGRLSKFFKEIVLLEQQLVMDSSRTVDAAAKELGARPVAFLRFQLGEDLEK